MRKKILSLAMTLCILVTLVAAVSLTAAAAKDYVVVIEDFENKDKVATYLPLPNQRANLYQSGTHKLNGKSSGLFVSVDAYGCARANYANEVSLVMDGGIMATNKANVFDAIRVHILNPGKATTLRMQYTSSLATTFFYDLEIKSSDKFVAYDFPIADFTWFISDSNSDKKFKDVSDPLEADIWDLLLVYKDDTKDLKLYLDDMSLVKYNYTPPAVTTTTETAITTEGDKTSEATSSTATAITTSQRTTKATSQETTASSVLAGDKKSNPPVLLIVLIVVGVLVAAGVVTFMVIKKKGGTETLTDEVDENNDDQ